MLSDEQIAVVAAEMRLPMIAVRMAARQRGAGDAGYSAADLIGDLNAWRVAREPRPLG
jgi:hypothetical protein